MAQARTSRLVFERGITFGYGIANRTLLRWVFLTVLSNQ